MTSRISLVLAGSILSSFIYGCGSSSDDRDINSSLSNSLVSNAEEGQAAVSISLNEVTESLSDSNIVSSSGSFGLADTSYERSCEAKDGTAIVTIKGSKTSNSERSNKKFTVTASSTMSNQLIRTWSKEGATLACAANKKYVGIDFESDVSGHKLSVSLERSNKRSLTRQNIKTAESKTVSQESAVSGKRDIQWLSQTALESGGLSRSHSMSFSTTRTESYLAKDGTTQSLKFDIKTSEADPLKVTLIWDTVGKSRQLVSKEIQSGSIQATRLGGGTMTASYSKLLMTYSASTCQFVSGTIEAKLYGEGQTQAGKSYKLTAVSGTITVLDVTDANNPIEIEDFDYTPCDIKDFNF